ncbi:MFS transporter [Entomospira culicis]|uniref:MFS transporter n=1 Tax=Entomospira culicis TaxID=2719989 RepID=A0A968GFJ4_9SPIO|nr:MFS transporter [Entomospira culicis]NIZ18681.1 MFS transporter [Entomospira culicis]NIZ68896.1 MFS transporter [Entomospira culicis]WDI37489.1 MFS transporter [Entomospira culicis]WDI39117.1 MFS transporter [Entomospira culicis]
MSEVAVLKQTRATFGVYGQLLLLAMSAGAIFRLIYLRANFQEVLESTLKISVAQLNALYAWMGLAIVLGYLPSGWLADRFSVKRLIMIALTSTALLSAGLATLPPYAIARWLYVGLGFSAVFLFWSAHMRSAKLLSNARNEGRIFGLLDGGRGGFEALFATVATILYQWMVRAETHSLAHQEAGMRSVFLYFSTLQLGLAVLVVLFLQDEVRVERVDKAAPRDKERGWFVWKLDRQSRTLMLLMSAIIFSGYTLFFTGFSFYGLLSVNFALDSGLVMRWISLALWMRLVGSMLGGFLADRWAKPMILLIAMVGSMLGLILLLTVLKKTTLVVVVVIAVSLTNAMIRGVYWSLLHYIRVDKRYLGRMIGMISFVGYLPDLLLPWVSVYLFARWDNASANTLYLWGSLGIGGLGLMSLGLFWLLSKREFR